MTTLSRTELLRHARANKNLYGLADETTAQRNRVQEVFDMMRKFTFFHDAGGKRVMFVWLTHEMDCPTVNGKVERMPVLIPSVVKGGIKDELALITGLNQGEVTTLMSLLAKHNTVPNVQYTLDEGDWIYRQEEELIMCNMYQPAAMCYNPEAFRKGKIGKATSKEKDALYDFIKGQCSDDNDLTDDFFRNLAHKYANPTQRSGIMTIFCGEEGGGKSNAIRCIIQPLGSYGWQRTEHSADKFADTDHPMPIEAYHELLSLTSKQQAIVRSIITEPKRVYNRKYKDVRDYTNCTTVYAATNASHGTTRSLNLQPPGRRFRLYSSMGTFSTDYEPALRKHGLIQEFGESDFLTEKGMRAWLALAYDFYKEDPNYAPRPDGDEATQFSCPMARAHNIVEEGMTPMAQQNLNKRNAQAMLAMFDAMEKDSQERFFAYWSSGSTNNMFLGRLLQDMVQLAPDHAILLVRKQEIAQLLTICEGLEIKEYPRKKVWRLRDKDAFFKSLNNIATQKE